jgi:CheY-like chemotaxis protein
MGSVLLVDDDPDGRESVARSLMKAGHTVRAVGNGREALISLVMSVPHVIVLDLRMPEMDGLTFLEVVRGYLRWSAVPVVLLTAFPDDAPIERLHGLGVRTIFVKANYRLDDLLGCVRKLVNDPEARCDTLGNIGA